MIYSPRGCWHGFNNTSNEDVVLVWGWMGAGSIEASGYEVDPESHKPMSAAWDDPRIARGMEAQLAARRARIAAGDKPLGWKVGLGAPAAMERLDITAPLVGFLMQKSLLPTTAARSRSQAGRSRSPSRRSPSTWRRTLPAAPTAPRRIAAIAALGPAIETRRPRIRRPTMSERVLAGNIFQRHVILGAPDTARAGAASSTVLRGHVFRRGAQVAAAGQTCRRNIGEIVDIVRARRRHARRLRRDAARGRGHHHRLDRAAAMDRRRPGGHVPVRFRRRDLGALSGGLIRRVGLQRRKCAHVVRAHQGGGEVGVAVLIGFEQPRVVVE